MKTQSKQSLVGGGLLILLGVISLVETYIGIGTWVWVVFLAATGLGVYGVYAIDRTEKWMLYVSYALLAIALMVSLITLDVLRGEAVATYVLSAIALPFLYVYLQDRTQWYMLVPTYTLLAVGVMVGLIGLGILNDFLIPAYVMISIAVPFFVVYARNRTLWWALVPGVIMGLMGVAFLIADSTVQYLGPAALIIAGIWVLARQFIRKEA